MGYLENVATISLIFFMLDVCVLSLNVTAPQDEYLYNEGQTATLQCTYHLSMEVVQEITWERKRESDFNFIRIFRLLGNPGHTNVLTWYQEFYSLDPINNPGRASYIGSSINGSFSHFGNFSAAIQINSFVSSDDAKYMCAIKALNTWDLYNTNGMVEMEVRYNFFPKTPSIFLNYGGRFNIIPDKMVNLAPNETVIMKCRGNVGRPNGMLRWEQSFGKSNSWGAIRDTVSSYQIIQTNTDGTAIGQIMYSKIFFVTDDTIKFRCLADRESVGLSDVTISSVIQFKVHEHLSSTTIPSVDVTVPEHLSSTTIPSIHDESPALKAALGTLMPILIILLVICLLLIAYLWRKLKAPAQNNGHCRSEATVNMTRRQLPAFTNAHSHIDNLYAHTNQGTTLHEEEKHYQPMHRPDVHTSNIISGNNSNVQSGEEEYENLEQRVYLELE